MSITWSLLYL